MILVLPEEKKNKIVEQCQFLLKKTLVAIRELSQIIGRLASSASTSTIPSSATSANNGFSMEKDNDPEIDLSDEVGHELNG